MRYLLLLLTIFLTSCSKPTFDIWDKMWDRIDNPEEQPKMSESDYKLIEEATEKEWEEVDKQTDK
tara:strand:+ start:205 stop:399 length:195 start_codon:yes stop_codon:yes gene_type:complete